MEFLHGIGKQTLDIEVATEALALALQARLPDANRRSFLPLIERVFEEFAPPPRHLKIKSLNIDLGSIPFSSFEEVAAERLERELRRALAEIVRDLEEGRAAENVLQSEGLSRLGLLEQYLLYGTLPSRASGTLAFSLEQLILESADSDPAGLAGVIRRSGRRTYVLKRLVLQLGDGALGRLLRVLDPEHAALIVLYLADLGRIHRVEPVLALGERQFARLLWLLVLTYITQDAGTHFNRKSFLKALLRGMAEGEKLEYEDLLLALRRGLQETGNTLPLKSSLLTIIGELASDLAAAGAEDFARTPARAENDRPPRAEIPDGQVAEAAEAFASLERYLSTGRMPAGDVLAVLAPEMRSSVAVFVEVCSHARAMFPQGSQEPEAETDETPWEVVLEYLLGGAQGRPELRSLIRHSIEALAGRAGMSVEALAERLKVGLARIPTRDEARLRQVQEAVDSLLSDRALWARQAVQTFERHDRVEVLRYYLRHGMLPWGALLGDSESDARELLPSLPRLQRSQMRGLFSSGRAEERMRMLTRAVGLLTEDGLAELLGRLFRRSKEDTGGVFWSSLARFAARAVDKPAFYARLIAANLDGQPFDLEELASNPLGEGVAAAPATGVEAIEWDAQSLKSALANRLRFGVEPRAGEPPVADLLHKLLTAYPQDARHFLHALRDAPEMLDALARECAAPLFERILGSLSPAGAETLAALAESHAAIPIPYRQSSEEKFRLVILQELLHLGEGRPLDSDFFIRVLRKLFGTPVPGPAARSLLRETVSWSASGRLPRADVEALEAAIKSGEARAGGEKPPEATAARRGQEGAARQVSPELRQEVFAFLLGGGQVSHGPDERGVEESSQRRKSLSDDALIHELLMMMDESPDMVGAFVRQHLSGRRARERWVKILPESALVRLSYLIEPRQHRSLMDSAEALRSAWLEASPPGAVALADRKFYWGLIFEFLARNTAAERSAERFVRTFFEHFAARYRALSRDDSERRKVGARLFEHAGRLAGEAGHSALLATLQRDRALLLSAWEQGPARAPASAAAVEVRDERRADEGRPQPSRRTRVKTAFGLAEEEAEMTGEPLYVDNAGLVLTGPFLPHLFQSLGMLREDEQGRTRLRDPEAVSRAVHLLQYLVDGRTDAPEPLLVLNKIICGVPTSAPVARGIDPTEEERALCEQLLRAMIANWKIIENTSIAGLQETFLQRAGRLEHSSDGWKLRVQRKTLDVLVDQIPWSLSVMYHNWMPQPLYVNW